MSSGGDALRQAGGAGLDPNVRDALETLKQAQLSSLRTQGPLATGASN